MCCGGWNTRGGESPLNASRSTAAYVLCRSDCQSYYIFVCVYMGKHRRWYRERAIPIFLFIFGFFFICFKNPLVVHLFVHNLSSCLACIVAIVLPLSFSLLRLDKLEKKKNTHTKTRAFLCFFDVHERVICLFLYVHTPLLRIFLFYYLKSAPFFPDFLLALVLFSFHFHLLRCVGRTSINM